MVTELFRICPTCLWNAVFKPVTSNKWSCFCKEKGRMVDSSEFEKECPLYMAEPTVKGEVQHGIYEYPVSNSSSYVLDRDLSYRAFYPDLYSSKES